MLRICPDFSENTVTEWWIRKRNCELHPVFMPASWCAQAAQY